MTQKQRNPDVDFGFHASIPRVVRTGYKNLTPVQKWLYVCLKDLCGDHGTCYRSLRALSDETGISTGMLSESIPLLHHEGLIHAEKKKRTSGGKEVWHITIVDIWKANGISHPTKRSHSEQTSENVHTVNENVHTVNDEALVCSHSERECSHSETEVITKKKEQNEERTSEEDAAIAQTVRQVTEAFPAPTLETVVPRSYSRKQAASLPGKGESKKRSSVTFASQAAVDLHTQWIQAYGPYGDTQWDIAALDWIAESHGTFEDIQLVYDFLKQKKPSESVRPEVVKNNWFRVNDLRKIKRDREKASSQKRSHPAHVDDDDEPLQYRTPPSQRRNNNNHPFQAIAAARRA